MLSISPGSAITSWLFGCNVAEFKRGGIQALSLHHISHIPTFALVDDKENLLKSWIGIVDINEVNDYISKVKAEKEV